MSKHSALQPEWQPWREEKFWSLRVRGLTWLQALMYRGILQGAWGLKTAPLISNDPQVLSGLAGVPREVWEENGNAVMKMFSLSQDGKFYSHERLTEDWRDALKRMRKNRLRSSKGGKAKQIKRLTECLNGASSTPQARTSTLEAAYNNTVHNNTEQEKGGEADAQDLPPLALAQKVAAELSLRGTGIIPAIGGAIQALVVEGKSHNAAVEFLIAHGKDAQGRGETVNRFWFDDSKWRKTPPAKDLRGYVPLPEEKAQ